MLTKPRLANPSSVRQAPDNMALNHATNLVVESQQLATPFEAQQYLEPGVNVGLKHRRKPKTNYAISSDMPSYPLGFVPTNQTPGANGEEGAEIVVKEAVPADLMDMFAKISAQQGAESKAVEIAKKEGRFDIGTFISEQYKTALNDINIDAKIERLVRRGFTGLEAEEAVAKIRMEEAVKVAKEPPRPAPVETVLREMFPPQGREIEVQTDVTVEPEKVLIARKARRTNMIIAAEKARLGAKAEGLGFE